MRVALSCDVLRPGNVERNYEWLCAILQPTLETPECQAVVHTRDDPCPDPAMWPRLYSDPSLLDAVRLACRPLLGCDLVIGHELSPNQLRVLHDAGVPALDVSIDPVRFGTDLFLRARTADPALAALLLQHRVADASLAVQVAGLREQYRAAVYLPRPALLFAGQLEADASLIEGARFCSAFEFVDEIRSLLEPGWDLLLKPHPYARSSPDIDALRTAFPGSRVVEDNVYGLLCAGAVQHVVTLSSSVATEARLLGIPTTMLLRPDRDTAIPAMPPVRITATALAAVLRSRFGQAGAGGPPTAEPIDLRKAVGQDWGFEAPRRRRHILFAGQSFSFGEAGPGADLCTFGWSTPERDGLWSTGPHALMLLQPQVSGLCLDLRLAAFVPRGQGPVRVAIHGGDGAPVLVHFRHGRDHRVTIPLPPTPGPVELRFDLSGISSPAEHGVSGDRRRLGVMLRHGAILSRSASGNGRVRRLARYGAYVLTHLGALLTGAAWRVHVLLLQIRDGAVQATAVGVIVVAGEG